MKICFCVSSFLSRSQTFVTNQVLHTVRAGHQVSVACADVAGEAELNDADQALIDKVTIVNWPPSRHPVPHRLKGQVSDRVNAFRDARAWRRQTKVDVVVAHFGYQGARVARAQAGWVHRPPLVTIYHGRDVTVEQTRDGMAKYQQLFDEGDLHLPVNEAFARLLVNAGAPADRVETLHLGVPVDRYPYAPKPIGTPLRLISVCRLVEKKGLDVALRGLAMFRDRHPDIAWTYDIGGGGPMDAALRATVSALTLDAHVRFLGPLSHDETLKRIAEADAVLATSVTAADGDQEGIPVTLMEAMALGTIIISSRHSGIPELVEHGVNGLLVEEGDATGVYTCLRALVDGHHDFIAMAGCAREKVAQEFNASRQMTKLLHLIGTAQHKPRSIERTG